MAMEAAPGIFGLFGVLLFLVGGTLSLALIGFWIWMLVDCASKEPDQGNTKVVWILVIVLTGWVGALIYYFVRRPERIRENQRNAQ